MQYKGEGLQGNRMQREKEKKKKKKGRTGDIANRKSTVKRKISKREKKKKKKKPKKKASGKTPKSKSKMIPIHIPHIAMCPLFHMHPPRPD